MYTYKNNPYIYLICMYVYTHPHIYKDFMVETKQLAKLTHEVGMNHKTFNRSRLFSQFSAKQLLTDKMNMLFKY